MKAKGGSLLIFLGLLLIAAAFSLVGYNFYEAYQAQQNTVQVLEDLQIPTAAPTEPAQEDAELPQLPEETVYVQEVEIPDYVLNPEMDMPVQTVKGQDYICILEIPAYGLELPVISQWSYPKLRIAPCRYSGSAYTDDLIIAAHNYRSHFANLKNLQEGDKVTVTDMDGNVFCYEVAVREVLEPTAVEEMVSGEWDLTLFTCTQGGSYRVVVRCDRVGEPQ